MQPQAAAGGKPMIHVEFINLPVEDQAASRKEGRPIFRDVEHCRIRWVGDNKRELCEPAHQKTEYSRDERRYITFAEKFPEHYKLFKANQDQAAVNGTPISELPFLSESKRAELRALNITTAEALAGLDGTPLQRLGMGGRDLKNQAQAWLDKASGVADVSKMAQEIEALKAMIANMGAAQTPAPEPVAESDTPSPFENWDDDTIRVWIREQGGEEPHHKTGHAKLVQAADALNAKLAAREAA